MMFESPARSAPGAGVVFGVFALLTLASGCPFEQARPLGPASQAVADATLVGAWMCTEPSEPEVHMTVAVTESVRRTYSIVLSAPEKKTARLRAFITRTGSTSILNVQQIGGSDLVSTGKYAFVRYVRQADGSLTLDAMKRANGVDTFDDLLRCVRKDERGPAVLPSLTLTALDGLPPFEVTLGGAPIPSSLSNVPSLYFEWWFGDRMGDRWATRWSGGRSSKSLGVTTPRGTIELQLNDVRLYLAAVATQRFGPADVATAPPAMREELARATRSLVAEEYRLEAGHRYYAHVARESFRLPPRGGGPPTEREHVVLAISDAPFVNNQPQRPLTPAYQALR